MKPLRSIFQNIIGGAAAMAISTSVAAAHDDHTHGAQDALQIDFSTSVLCGDAEAFSRAKSECYSLYAETMQDYVQAYAAPLMQAQTLAALQDLLTAQGATTIEVDEQEQVIKARWKNERNQMHREHDPAYIKVQLGQSFVGAFFQGGVMQNPMGGGLGPEMLHWSAGNNAAMQWYNEEGLIHNENGPALADYTFNDFTLKLYWYLEDQPASLDGSPSEIEANVNTNVAYYQEWQAGSGDDLQRMHRHDCVYKIHNDPQSGQVSSMLYHFHDRDPLSDDEVEKEIFFGPAGEIINEIWYDGTGQEIEPIINYVVPADNYCQPPDHSHVVAPDGTPRLTLDE